MSILDTAQKPVAEAPIITIVGFPGAGKTSLAGLFPKPIFIQAENAGTVFETWSEEDKPSLLPQIKPANKVQGIRASEQVKDYLKALCTEDHDYKTVVIDSVSILGALYESEVVEFDKNEVQSIGDAAGGFHKGYDVSMGMHTLVLRAAEALKKKGITVVFLSHSAVVKLKNRPDEASDYAVYTMELHERSRKLYIAKSDAVLYLKEQQFVTGAKSDKKGNQTSMGRVQSTGDRVLITSSDGTIGFVDAKNRYDLPKSIDVPKGTNPLLELIPFFNNKEA